MLFSWVLWLGFLSRNYWSLLDHDLMASIWEKAISILAGNLNSGHSYLITAVRTMHFIFHLQVEFFSHFQIDNFCHFKFSHSRRNSFGPKRQIVYRQKVVNSPVVLLWTAHLFFGRIWDGFTVRFLPRHYSSHWEEPPRSTHGRLNSRFKFQVSYQTIDLGFGISISILYAHEEACTEVPRILQCSF